MQRKKKKGKEATKAKRAKRKRIGKADTDFFFLASSGGGASLFGRTIVCHAARISRLFSYILQPVYLIQVQ